MIPPGIRILFWLDGKKREGHVVTPIVAFDDETKVVEYGVKTDSGEGYRIKPEDVIKRILYEEGITPLELEHRVNALIDAERDVRRLSKQHGSGYGDTGDSYYWDDVKREAELDFYKVRQDYIRALMSLNWRDEQIAHALMIAQQAGLR